MITLLSTTGMDWMIDRSDELVVDCGGNRSRSVAGDYITVYVREDRDSGTFMVSLSGYADFWNNEDNLRYVLKNDIDTIVNRIKGIRREWLEEDRDSE